MFDSPSFFRLIHNLIPPLKHRSLEAFLLRMQNDSAHFDLTAAREEMNALLCDYASDPERYGVNGLRLLMTLAGVMVETSFLFESPDESLDGLVRKIARLVDCVPARDVVPVEFLPSAYVLDDMSELGRDVARHMLKQGFDESHEFAGVVVDLIHHNILMLEEIGIPRDESFRILCEFATRAMVFEVAAQELCDVLIDHKMSRENWSLGDCISALSGLSGYKVAVWYQNTSGSTWSRKRAEAQTFDAVVDVMTREAVRYGIAGGTDWRFGLPANDKPADPPSVLISGILPICEDFFRAVRAFDPVFQAVACAKAAGRMLAVASGGEMPELSPVIAKPLAIAAMTESYRSLV